ncbi:MAG TPA: hypothetical protein VKB70_04770 [Gaiellaceae bacterium]|nr:hypothetical protein [Gaiellaceae bacterium]
MRDLARTGVWTAFTVWLSAAVAGLWLTIATWGVHARPFTDPALANARDIVLGAVFAFVGLVLAAKRPGNVVGWLLLGVALSLALNVLFVRYAVYGLLAHPGSLPGATVAAALGSSAWVILISSLALLFLTFPHGRLPSPRWRITVWAVLFIDGSTWVGNTLVPGPLTRPLNAYDNPIGIGALRSLGTVLSAPGFLIIVIFAASAVSLVLRFRQARGEERQQYKWFTFAAALFPIAMVAVQVLDAVFGQASTEDTVGSTITGIVATAVPVATAVAVLRYRLYEIDVIVRRTLIYGAVSALLAGVYAGVVLLLQAAFGSVTRGNELAVAGSTLAVAALFRPVLRRVQTVVDRRFFRSKVDAETTLAQFGARLRHEADLESLLAEMYAVVGQTMAPAHFSLWLKGDHAVRRNDLGTVTE